MCIQCPAVFTAIQWSISPSSLLCAAVHLSFMQNYVLAIIKVTSIAKIHIEWVVMLYDNGELETKFEDTL